MPLGIVVLQSNEAGEATQIQLPNGTIVDIQR
jgi:hypothetical protein